MLKDDILLTDSAAAKKRYINMMSETVNAVSDAFIDDKAYSGPTPEKLRQIIHQTSILPEKGIGWEAVLDKMKKEILPNLLRTSSADYMAHLHGPSLLETIAGELVISAFNQSMDSWDQAPVATEVEIEVINHLCDLYGYDKEADGVFTSGGSQSNQTAMTIARDWFCMRVLNHDVKKYGLPADFRKLRMYTSEVSHFSMDQSAHLLGLGYESVVKVPVDSRKKMDIAALKKLIAKDKQQGNIPFLVVATAGTTDFGSIDPLQELSEIASADKMWLHADAAYGSGVIMSAKYRNRVADLKLCNSITVDFHKMFLMPISCSAVLVKDGRTFDTFVLHADYLNRTEDEEDGYINLVNKSVQTTRRFDALKVWISFQMRGKAGWNEIIGTNMENALYLYNKLKSDKDFQVVIEPEISSVVFRYVSGQPDKDDDINKKIRRRLMHEYGIVIGQTVSDNHVCLKFTLLNPLITEKKLNELIELIRVLGK